MMTFVRTWVAPVGWFGWPHLLVASREPLAEFKNLRLAIGQGSHRHNKKGSVDEELSRYALGRSVFLRHWRLDFYQLISKFSILQFLA